MPAILIRLTLRFRAACLISSSSSRPWSSSPRARSRAATVAFRLILAIPHGFVLLFLDLVGFLVAFVGWWGALFIGRLPTFAVSYLSGLARWNARYIGYLFLLTDDYPPFTFDDDPAYPVVIAIPPAGRLIASRCSSASSCSSGPTSWSGW